LVGQSDEERRVRKGERKELAIGVHTAVREEGIGERAVKWAEMHPEVGPLHREKD
jgi:hypothetical protein